MNCFFRIFTSLFIVLIGNTAYSQQEGFQCTLTGEVFNRPESTELLLIKEGDDLRISSISIPIENNTFNYSFEAKNKESYNLVFADEFKNGAWRPVTFFAEPGTINFNLYPMEAFELNSITGGKLNDEFSLLIKKQNSLFNFKALELESEKLQEDNRFLTEEAINVRAQISAAEDKANRDSLINVFQQIQANNRHLTPEAQSLTDKQRQLYIDMLNWKTDMVINNESLILYRELINLLKIAQAPYRDPLPIMVHDLIDAFEKNYRPNYPAHPYTKRTETFLAALQSIQPGGYYIDFTAPDFEGNPVTLSEKIKGKITLINLWASWCAPCRTKGKELIPIYEEYHQKGFEVIGVARERNKEAGIKAAAMDEYPWLNLLELNDENNIWQKYGIGNSGGGLFLVDGEGTILAVSPTAEETRKFLEELLD